MKKTFALVMLFFCFSGFLKAQEKQMSKVVFLRTFNYIGCAIGYNIHQDTTKLARLKAQTFAVKDLEAKPTRLWAKTEVKRYLDIDLKPNHIYFVRGRITWGWFVGRPRLETLNVNEFQALVSRKKYLQKQIKNMGFENAEDFVKPYQIIQFTSL
jgi:hypothetical protein